MITKIQKLGLPNTLTLVSRLGFVEMGLVVVLALALVLGVGAMQAKAATTFAVNAITETGPLTISSSSVGSGAIVVGTATSTSAMTFGLSTAGQTVNVGTGAGVTTLNLGTANTSGVITIGATGQTGNVIIFGAITGGSNALFNNTTTANTTILAAATSGTITIGGTAQTGTITLGSSSGNGIIAIGAGAGVTTIQLGVGDGADIITVGDANADVSIVDAQWGVTAAGVVTAVTVNTTGNGADGSVRTAAGIAGAPAYSFTGDTDTGMRNSADGELTFASNAGSAVTMSNTGISATGGIKSSSLTSGIGYTAGGAVTQGTNRTTGVTLNTMAGAITLVSAAGTSTPQSFTVTNSAITATDVIIVNQKSGTDIYSIFVTAVAGGSFRITFFNSSGTNTEQPVFNFAVIRAIAS